MCLIKLLGMCITLAVALVFSQSPTKGSSNCLWIFDSDACLLRLPESACMITQVKQIELWIKKLAENMTPKGKVRTELLKKNKARKAEWVKELEKIYDFLNPREG